jgi:PAS domain S-box-containing protein
MGKENTDIILNSGFHDIGDIDEPVIFEQGIFFKLTEYVKDAIVICSQKKVYHVNEAFHRLYGTDRSIRLTNPDMINDLIYPDDRERYKLNRMQAIQSGGDGQPHAYRIRKSDGTVSNVMITHYPIFNASGKATRILSVTAERDDTGSVPDRINDPENLILDNIPYLLWLKDEKGKYVLVNRAFAQVYNLEPTAIIGKSDFNLCSKIKALEFQRSDQKVRRTKKRIYIEQVEELKTGRAIYETCKTPLFNDAGKFIGIAGASRDVADLGWMEKSLRVREEQVRGLLQNSSDAISIIDRHGKIIFESSEKNKISDFAADELLNKPFFDIVHPDDVNSIRLIFKEVLSNPGRQIKKEYRSLHKNKRWIYVESIFSNQLKNQAIKGIIVNSRDVSDRKMAELKERVYHDNLIFLSNSALELLGLSSKDQIFKYIPEKLAEFLESAVVVVTSYDKTNRQMVVESVSGLPPFENQVEQILGRSLVGMTFPADEDAASFANAGTVVTVKDEFLNNGIGTLTIEKIDKFKDLLHIHKSYNILLARDNKYLGNITILTLNKSIIKFKHIIETFVHQVSVALHRSQLEYELVKAKDKAEESDRLKTAFLANMSHEIRTPMNGILGFAEMLNDTSLRPADRKKYLEIINSNGKMLINLIDDIIDFAKIESGQVNIQHDDFSLNTLLNQVQSTFLASRLRKDRTSVKIITKKPFPDDKSYIRSDPIRLRQILTNLVGNALKFTHKGYIEFGYNLENKNILRFYVKDTGIGIPADKLQSIFERFVQADSSPSRKYGGSGLGLAISKGFVELLGGKMWAESVMGEGSTFYFTIPFHHVHKKTEDKFDSKPRTNYSWEGKLFLIAEDDKFSYKFLEGFLKQTRAQVIRASDGKEAVEICRQNRDIDLILMDIQMPEMNGLAATEEIKKFNRKVPIIAQTANAISEEKQRCMEAGCDDFITKPVNISELYAMIDKWLTIKQQA